MTGWRAGWEPFDPLRPCYTCGGPPGGWFDRGRTEPRYPCRHDPILDDLPRGRWSTRALAEEWDAAYREAARWVREDEALGYSTKYVPRGRSEVDMKARGIIAEFVAARLAGLARNPRPLRRGYRRSAKRADVGANVEVRNTADHAGPLMLYDNDPADRLALLVTGEDPFVLRGWARVGHVKVRRLYRARPEPGRWVVPQSLLHPMPLPEGA